MELRSSSKAFDMDGNLVMNSPTILETFVSQEEHLESMLQRRLGGRVRSLRIICKPDGIVLQGMAATYHAKQLAQHAAMELADLPILANDIEVL